MANIRIDDLQNDDIADATWSGSSLHLQKIAEAVEQVALGNADYLGAWSDEQLVGLCGMDYAITPGSGRLWQLVVHPDFRSHGIGTMLIAALEDRVKARGLDRCELLVEKINTRAHDLYLHLGYHDEGTATDSWDEMQPDGSTKKYIADCFLMSKQL